VSCAGGPQEAEEGVSFPKHTGLSYHSGCVRARGLHTDHAASRRLSRASLIGSIFLVSVVSVFPAIHCDSLQFTAFVIWRARTITNKRGKLPSPHFSADIHSHSVNTIL
jgi:hypothetical protein